MHEQGVGGLDGRAGLRGDIVASYELNRAARRPDSDPREDGEVVAGGSGVTGTQVEESARRDIRRDGRGPPAVATCAIPPAFDDDARPSTAPSVKPPASLMLMSPIPELLIARLETATLKISAMPMPLAARSARLSTVMSVCAPAVPAMMPPPVRSDSVVVPPASVIGLLTVMLPGLDVLPIRIVGAKIRSSSTSESSSVPSLVEPRLIAQVALTGWIVTFWPAPGALIPEVLKITTTSALTVTSPEFENTADGPEVRVRAPFAPVVKVTSAPAVPLAAMKASGLKP